MTHPHLTPSQTLGPFFHDALLRSDALCPVLVMPETQGVRVRLVGRVLDGDGAGVPDAMLEIWQANHVGRYNHPADQRPLPLDPTFTGYGRTGTDATGAYWFETVKPGQVPFDDARLQAPHILVTVMARGLLNHLWTRLYFANEEANAADPVLQHVPIERRSTLLAQPDDEEEGRRKKEDASSGQDGPSSFLLPPSSLPPSSFLAYRFDIILQGAGETVFFNL